MKQFILTALVLLTTLNSAYAAQTKPLEKVTKEVFSVQKKDYNERMALYLYCLANTEHTNDLTKATEKCGQVLSKENSFDAQGLEDRITADIKPLNADIKDMLSCLTKEASSTSSLSDSSAVSFCEVMVNPTSGIEL